MYFQQTAAAAAASMNRFVYLMPSAACVGLRQAEKRQSIAKTRSSSHHADRQSNTVTQGRLLHINDGANAPWKK